MAQISLVGPNIEGAQAWLRLMERKDQAVRAAVFVTDEDGNEWKLLVVPKEKTVDYGRFYHDTAVEISKNRPQMRDFEVTDIVLADRADKVIKQLQKQVGQYRDDNYHPKRISSLSLNDGTQSIAFLFRLAL